MLTTTQKGIYTGLISLYESGGYLKTRILFLNTQNYEPIFLPYGKFEEYASVEELWQKIEKQCFTEDNHDGSVFVYPDGQVATGVMIDVLSLVDEVPEEINESGVARSILRIITETENTLTPVALSCGYRLFLFEGGRKTILKDLSYKKDISALPSSYGTGIIVGEKITLPKTIYTVKMENFEADIEMGNLSVLAEKIMNICTDHEHHDGMWHYNPIQKTISGPYMIVPKVLKEHVASYNGTKRVVAKLMSVHLNLQTMVIRENTTNIISFNELDPQLTADLQYELDKILNGMTVEQQSENEEMDQLATKRIGWGVN